MRITFDRVCVCVCVWVFTSSFSAAWRTLFVPAFQPALHEHRVKGHGHLSFYFFGGPDGRLHYFLHIMKAGVGAFKAAHSRFSVNTILSYDMTITSDESREREREQIGLVRNYPAGMLFRLRRIGCIVMFF